MLLTKWGSELENPALPAEFKRFFEGCYPWDFGGDNSCCVPSVNVSETNESFRVEIAVPGMQKDNLKVVVEEGILTVKGEQKEKKKEDGKKFSVREFRYGSFSRSFSLPDRVDSENFQANYSDGILTVVLPKNEPPKQKPVKEIKIS